MPQTCSRFRFALFRRFVCGRWERDFAGPGGRSPAGPIGAFADVLLFLYTQDTSFVPQRNAQLICFRLSELKTAADARPTELPPSPDAAGPFIPRQIVDFLVRNDLPRSLVFQILDGDSRASVALRRCSFFHVAPILPPAHTLSKLTASVKVFVLRLF